MFGKSKKSDSEKVDAFLEVVKKRFEDLANMHDKNVQQFIELETKRTRELRERQDAHMNWQKDRAIKGEEFHVKHSIQVENHLKSMNILLDAHTKTLANLNFTLGQLFGEKIKSKGKKRGKRKA